MIRYLALSTLLGAAALTLPTPASAATLTWTLDTSFRADANSLDITACEDGRVYALGSGGRLIRANAGASPILVGTVLNPRSISCVNNVLYHLDSMGQVFRNDGTPNNVPSTFLTALGGVRSLKGGTSVALFIPVSIFVRLDNDGSVHWANSPTGTWARVGTAGGAEQIAVGGGFLEWRAYAKNFDDSVWENAGQACDAYWRRLGARPTLRAFAATGVDRLIGLDDNGQVFRGTIGHERRAIVLGASEFALLNVALSPATLRADGAAAVFNPGGILAGFGLGAATFRLPTPLLSTPLGSSTYSASNVNLTSLLVSGSGSNVLLNARFEETGLEVLSSNSLFPNLNITNIAGQVTLGGRVGRCGQPEVSASAATFAGNFSGVDNLFSFVVDAMNGDIRAQVQSALLAGVRDELALPGTQLGLQRALLDVARTLTGGPAWSHIVGNTFQVTGGTIRFSVER